MVKVVSSDSSAAAAAKTSVTDKVKSSITLAGQCFMDGVRKVKTDVKAAATAAAEAAKPAAHVGLANVTGSVPGNIVGSDGTIDFFAACKK